MITPTDELDGAPLLRTEVVLDAGHGDVTDARLHVSALGVFEASSNGRPGRRRRAEPRLEQLRVAAALPQLRRHRPAPRTHRAGPRARQRLVPRPARLERPARALRRPARRASPSSRSRSRTGTSRSSSPTRPGRPAPRTWWPTTSTTARPIDARRRDDTWTVPVRPRPAAAPSRSLDFDTARARAVRRPAGACGNETLRPDRDLDLAVRRARWSTSGRTSSAGCGCAVRGAAGPAGHRPARRGARARRARRPPAAHRRGHRPVRAQRRRRRLRADLHLPRLPLRRGRRAGRASSPPSDLEAVVVHSDLRRTGHFECSDPLLNQLHRNVVWGLRGNFLDVPTDCPQRDERLGWTGDIAVFAPDRGVPLRRRRRSSATGWSTSRLEQRARRRDGAVRRARRAEVQPPPNGLPRRPTPPRSGATPRCGCRGRCGRRTATARCSSAQYDSMAAHVRRVESLLSPNGPVGPAASSSATGSTRRRRRTTRRGQGRHRRRRDRLRSTGPRASSPTPPSCSAAPTTPPRSRTSRAARRDAFNEHYVARRRHASTATAPRSTRWRSSFGLLDAASEAQAGRPARRAGRRERLPDLDRVRRARRTSRDALTATGHLDDAYRLLLERECPSWLYPVTMGATTVWERWDSMLPDGTINPGEMTSLQPLRAGRGRRLDAPHRRRASRRSEPGYSPGARRPATRRRPDLGGDDPGDAARPRRGRAGASTDGRLTRRDRRCPTASPGVLRLPGQRRPLEEGHVRSRCHTQRTPRRHRTECSPSKTPNRMSGND